MSFMRSFLTSRSQPVFASALRSGPVTPHEDTPLQFKALYVSVAGDVYIKHTATGVEVKYPAVPAGKTLEVAGVRVTTNTVQLAGEIVWMDW